MRWWVEARIALVSRRMGSVRSQARGPKRVVPKQRQKQNRAENEEAPFVGREIRIKTCARAQGEMRVNEPLRKACFGVEAGYARPCRSSNL